MNDPLGQADPRQPAVQASKTLALKAIYSRSSKSAQSLFTDINVNLYYEDSGSGKRYADLLERSDNEAVIIACVRRLYLVNCR